MDELERKIVAHEMALIETVAHIGADHLLESVQAIRAGLIAGITEEEQTIRITAIDLLQAALERLGRPAPDVFGVMSLAEDLAAKIARPEG